MCRHRYRIIILYDAPPPRAPQPAARRQSLGAPHPPQTTFHLPFRHFFPKNPYNFVMSVHLSKHSLEHSPLGIRGFFRQIFKDKSLSLLLFLRCRCLFHCKIATVSFRNAWKRACPIFPASNDVLSSQSSRKLCTFVHGHIVRAEGLSIFSGFKWSR